MKIKNPARVIRNTARATKTLHKIVGWKKLYAYTRSQTGYEIIQTPSNNQHENVLVIAPHPDDDVLGCGGAIALHNQAGDIVNVLYLADGTLGTPDGRYNAKLLEIRRNEAKAGINVLGGGQHFYYEFPDGKVRSHSLAQKFLRTTIDSIQPTIIYVPWFGEDHPDHQESCTLLKDSLKDEINKKIVIRQYEVWSPLIPNRILPIAPVVKKKEEAIRCHQSQLDSRDYLGGIIGLNKYRGTTSNLPGPAEAYFELPLKLFLDFMEHFGRA